MSELYLWDRSGPPDADIQRLENLLERYRLNTLAPLRSRANGSGPLPTFTCPRAAM